MTAIEKSRNADLPPTDFWMILRPPMKKLTTLIMAVVTTCFIAASAHAGEAINKKCPLSGNDVNADKVSEVKVDFCCNNCKGKFEAAPAKFMKKAAKAQDGKCILSGKDGGVTATVKVAFCCGNCQGKFEKSPKKYLAKLAPAKKKKK